MTEQNFKKLKAEIALLQAEYQILENAKSCKEACEEIAVWVDKQDEPFSAGADLGENPWTKPMPGAAGCCIVS